MTACSTLAPTHKPHRFDQQHHKRQSLRGSPSDRSGQTPTYTARTTSGRGVADDPGEALPMSCHINHDRWAHAGPPARHLLHIHNPTHLREGLDDLTIGSHPPAQRALPAYKMAMPAHNSRNPGRAARDGPLDGQGRRSLVGGRRRVGAQAPGPARRDS
jgi:hypothetical protein